MNPDDPTGEGGPDDADPTDELDPTTRLPRPELEPAEAHRLSPTDTQRSMARRALFLTIPLLLIGALLVALGLPVWLIVIALAVSLAIVVFEVDL